MDIYNEANSSNTFSLHGCNSHFLCMKKNLHKYRNLFTLYLQMVII